MSLVFLLFTSVIARNLVHFRQATEFGVEQLKQDAGTDKVTFFAAMRQTLDDLDVEYVLSFGPPKCETSCAQSTSNICRGPQRIVNAGWEHIQLEHYPEATDPAAIYIRKSISLNDELNCNEGDLAKATSLSGNLYLSVALGCDEITGCPNFETVEIFPFDIDSVEDLNYHTSYIEYDAKATKNLRITNVGLFVELTTVILNNTNVNFTNPHIVSQDCEPKLRIVAMTDCELVDGNCKQKLYLSPIDGKDSLLEHVTGSLTIEVEFGSNETTRLNLLHVNVDIDSPTDFGDEERVIDSMFSILTDTYDAFFAGSNMTLIDKDRFCVSLASPKLIPVEILNVRTCLIDGSTCKELFNSTDSEPNDSERILTTDNQYMICLTMHKIAEAEQTIEVAYSLDQKHRGVYDGNTVQPTIIYCDCPYGYTWDSLCDCCVNAYHDWNWSWGWIWVVSLVVAGIVLTYCIVASTGCTHQPVTKPKTVNAQLTRWRQ
jgi:hypothetical protein